MRNTSKIRIFLLLIADFLFIPICVLCEHLTDHMLSQSGVCIWTLMGIQCLTCGGTRLVNQLLNGHIFQAFQLNPFIFLTILCLCVSYILLHLWWIWDMPHARKILKHVFSKYGLLVYTVCMVLFLILRNISTISHYFDFLKQLLMR